MMHVAMKTTSPDGHASLRRFFLGPAGVVLGLVVLGLVGILAVVQPGGSGVLGSVRLTDGSEYVVTQECNWSVEPYTVGFYMRSPEGRWGWCYIDHEATRWRDVKVFHEASTDRVIVTERGVRRAILNREAMTLWIDNGSIRGEVDAPQEWGRAPSVEE